MKDRKNVLVIDDEPIVLDSCRRILHDEGFEVNGAMNGREGLKKIEEDKYDAVLVDWKLPEIDGMEVLRIIKKNHPDIIVVMITGYPSVASAVQAMKLGVSNYVSKPFTPEELKDALINALEQSKTPKKEGPELESAIEAEVKRIIARTEERVEATQDEALVTPIVTPIPAEEGKVGPIRSFLATLWSRLFFIALGPIVIFAIITGVFKVVFGKKPLKL
ncbi:MAG: response regulator [candidate division Zixibacteria bacterium]|nr:response regulator [candidate division Zixibacteria bacterium]